MEGDRGHLLFTALTYQDPEKLPRMTREEVECLTLVLVAMPQTKQALVSIVVVVVVVVIDLVPERLTLIWRLI